ncbi:dipeptidyl aminopeptidase/acylaminoacyl peptidase [Actinoplanes tereljensis]|uniref:Peptidase S9 n=1 Tax=Paractinoplanes tereljensis TaxID=571912 RepID=A0A919TQ63_9ACTN|nr:prolyl oligopeptidase family serine peptidase [Actinoplanes tereljensis]GIF17961.1 peptidase S9 [Actinoplanes tereljensis]
MTGQLGRIDVTVLPVSWTKPLPPEAGGSWSPALSPDGEHCAYISDRGGRPQVWVQPVGAELAFGVDTGPEPVTAVHWSTGGGWLACQLAPGGGPRHELWLVRPDGSELHQVAGFGTDDADNVRWLPGRSLLAVTENLNTGLLIDPVHNTRSVVAKGSLTALLDVSATHALLRIGPRGDRQIVTRDLTTGADTMVALGEQAIFAADGTIYARSEAGEFPALIRVTPDGGVTVVAAAARAEVEAFTLTADASAAAVLWNVRGGESEVEIIDLRDGTRRRVEPLPGAVVSELSWSFDGSGLVFTAEGPGRPHGVWVHSGDEVHAVSAAQPAPGSVQPTLEVFEAHDGLELSGWLFRPAGDGPHPTVLWFHGGPEAQERPGHSPLFQSLVDLGIAVFAPNVRGSSGFGKSFVNADNGVLRYAGIEDVRSCVRHLVASGVSDESRIGIMGRSYGGFLTLAALTRFPDLFAVGIDVCGMSNFSTFYQHTEPWIAAAAISKYGDPAADAALLADLSPMTRIDRLRAPLMVVHGENDSNVPVIEAEQVVAALAERGIPHRYLLFPNEGHQLLHSTSRATYLHETLSWLSKHLR